MNGCCIGKNFKSIKGASFYTASANYAIVILKRFTSRLIKCVFLILPILFVHKDGFLHRVVTPLQLKYVAQRWELWNVTLT